MEVKFKIIEIDASKKANNENYIKVEIINNNHSIGEFWQDFKTLERNIKKIGINAYINFEEHKDAI